MLGALVLAWSGKIKFGALSGEGDAIQIDTLLIGTEHRATPPTEQLNGQPAQKRVRVKVKGIVDKTVPEAATIRRNEELFVTVIDLANANKLRSEQRLPNRNAGRVILAVE